MYTHTYQLQYQQQQEQAFQQQAYQQQAYQPDQQMQQQQEVNILKKVSLLLGSLQKMTVALTFENFLSQNTTGTADDDGRSCEAQGHHAERAGPS